VLYLNKSKETEGWCLTQQKIHQVQNPENSHRPPVQTLLCSVRCPMELFRSALYKTLDIYLSCCFTCKFEPMTRALFDQVQRDLRVVFEGPVWDATLIPTKFVGNLKWPASWHSKQKSRRSMWLQGSNCRELIVNRIFSEVVTELWGPILHFLEMRKVFEHWGEACPALMCSGLMKSEAHVKPFTLVLQPTIIHSSSFLYHWKFSYKQKDWKFFFCSILCSNPIWCNFVTLFSLVKKERNVQLQLKLRKRENILMQTHYKVKVFWNWEVTIS
jgi:hypothetical protein